MSNAWQFLLRYIAYPVCRVWWFVRRPKTCGVTCVVVCGGKLLLVRLGYAHCSWTLPGGGIDKRESAVEAASRELFEETGIDISPERWTVFGTYRQYQEYKDDTVVCAYAETDDLQYTVDNFEVVDAGWFAVKELPNPRSSGVNKILDLYEKNRHSEYL